MSVSIQFLKEERIVEVALSGVLTADSLRADYPLVVSECTGERGLYNRLWDLRESDFSELTSEMTQLFSDFVVAQNKTSSEHNKIQLKSALLTDDKLGFGFSRMYEILNSMAESNFDVGVFDQYEAAISWLRQNS